MQTFQAKASNVSNNSSNSDSMAKNYFHPLSGQVDPRTGQLLVSITPPKLPGIQSMDVDLGVVYNQDEALSALSLFGLPPGWSFNFSYIVNNRIFISGGQSYILDPEHYSGMQYYNLKNLKLFYYSSFNLPVFPYDPSEKYAYLLKFQNGQNQYFDKNGRLIGCDDKNGNHILFYYDKPDKNIYESKLIKVIDTYGQSININFSTDNIKINFPQGEDNNISYSFITDKGNSRLINYIDPINQSTSIEYNGGVVKTGLISKITYPNGLISTYKYSTIKYKVTGSTEDLLQDVVTSTINTYLKSSRTVSYNYNAKGDYHNYLGYPKFSVTPGIDTLLESNDNNYMYTTQVNNGVNITEHQYNRLHLELQTKTLTSDGKSIISLKTNTYVDEGGANYFPPFNELSPNYQSTKKVLNVFYNEQGQSRDNEKETDFNDYGQIVAVREYADPDNKGLVLVKATTSEYDINFGILTQKEIKDYRPDGLIVNTPKITRSVNQLTADKKNIQISQIGEVKNENFIPEKTKAFSYDNQGRVISNILSWSDKSTNKPGPSETGYFISYMYDPSTLEYSEIKKDFYGNASTEIFNSASGFLMRKVNALGYSISYTYDNLGRKLTRKDTMNNVMKWFYDNQINKTITEYSNGYKTYEYYDGFGNLIKKGDNAVNSQSERILQTTGYNNLGQKEFEMGILGDNSKITYLYNNRGLSSSATDSIGNVSRYTYDAVAKTKTTTFNNFKTKVEEYDSNRQIVLLDSYNPSNQDLLNSVRNTYNGNQLEVYSQSGDKSQDSNWTSDTSNYDISNNLISKSLDGWDGVKKQVNFTRDLLNKVVSSENTLTTPYQNLSKLTSSITNYNAIGQLIEEINPLNQSRVFEYDAVSNKISETDYKGKEFGYAYYPNNQLESKTYLEFDGTVCQTKYNYYSGNNQIKSVEDFVNEKSQGKLLYSYTLDNKITEIVYPDSKKVKWNYDQTYNRLDSYTDAGEQTTKFNYNSYGQLISILATTSGQSISFTYYSPVNNPANSGQLESIIYSNGIKIKYTYNGFNLIEGIYVTDNKNKNLMTAIYTFDNSTNNITSIKYTSNVVNSPSANYTSYYTYNAPGKLIEEKITNISDDIISTTKYQYDAADNVTVKEVDDSSGKTTQKFIYDSDNKLITITNQSGQFNPKYDENGNMIDDGQGNIFNYNAINQLIGYQDSSGIKTNYTYYPNGLRASKQVADSSPVYFYYDNNKTPNIINEIQENNTVYYLMSPTDRYIRFCKNNDSTITESLIQNKKDMLMVVDENGTPTAIYDYTAYGSSVDNKNEKLAYSIKDNPFKFTKEYLDSESGLYYLRSRYYNPSLLRFISRDNIVIFNHYNYGNGNPVMFVDQTGNSSWWQWLVTGVMVVASVAVTVLTAGAAAPEAAALDAAEIGGLVAADAAVTATESGLAAGEVAGEVAGAESLAAGSEASLGDLTSLEGESNFGMQPNGTNTNGLDNNCVFCTAGSLLNESAPEVAQSLGVQEGLVGDQNILPLFREVGLTESESFDITTRNPAQAFDYMARQPEGTRFAFGFRPTGGGVGHFITAQSEGIGNAVSFFDAQSGRAVFGDPAGLTSSEYFVLRVDDQMAQLTRGFSRMSLN